MKKLFTIFSVGYLTLVFACSAVAQKPDSSKIAFAIRCAASKISPPPLFIIDDKKIADSLSNNVLQSINPNNILEISVLKDSASEAISDHFNAGVIIITTKAYAKTTYQKKLSTFSKEYRNYLETHQRDSTDLFYVINGIPLDGKDENEITKALYDIPRKKLKSVTFMGKYFKGAFNNSKPLVIIVTKK
jgi:hypothetical protein